MDFFAVMRAHGPIWTNEIESDPCTEQAFVACRSDSLVSVELLNCI
jgi:hypothetical protein